MEERFMMGNDERSRELLENVRRSHEAVGCTCTYEFSTLLDRFEMITLVVTPALRPNRAERGCNLNGA
jgi:hypothetical protein